jgi:hypothetical protein
MACVRFVWCVTMLSLLSYGVLVIDYYHWRAAELQPVLYISVDRHVIFVVALLVLGSVVAYLVQRVRTLNNFYGGPV